MTSTLSHPGTGPPPLTGQRPGLLDVLSRLLPAPLHRALVCPCRADRGPETGPLPPGLPAVASPPRFSSLRRLRWGRLSLPLIGANGQTDHPHRGGTWWVRLGSVCRSKRWRRVERPGALRSRVAAPFGARLFPQTPATPFVEKNGPTPGQTVAPQSGVGFGETRSGRRPRRDRDRRSLARTRRGSSCPA